MNIRLFPIALSVSLGLAGCVTDYSKSEAPNNLGVTGSESRIDLAFAPGSARLASGEPARLDRLVAAGVIRPDDRVTVAASGSPGLAERRNAVLSSALLAYGIVADSLPLEVSPANHAIIGVGRYTVALPPCPNWSEAPQAEYTNAVRSNWGCADAINLGRMVASPADLVRGRTLALADGHPAVVAVQRYMTDRVKPLISGTATPFAGGGGAGGGGGGEGGGGTAGAGVGTGGAP